MKKNIGFSNTQLIIKTRTKQGDILYKLTDTKINPLNNKK